MLDVQALFQTIADFAYSIIVALVPLLLAYYAPIVKAWIAARIELMRQRMTDEQIYTIGRVADMAVSAVEQLKKTGAIVDNKHAFEQASAYAEQWLKTRGILLDMSELRFAIEAAVRDLPHEKPPAAARAPIVPGLTAGPKWE